MVRDFWEDLEYEAEQYATEILEGDEGCFDYQERFNRICESYILMKSAEMMNKGVCYD